MKQENKDARIRALEAIKVIADTYAHYGCKTIGNLNPEGMHCLTCTFNTIKDAIDPHVEFWRNKGHLDRAKS